MIKVTVVSNGKTIDISREISEMEWSGNVDSCARKIRFSVLTTIDIPLSSVVLLYKNNKEIFRGFVFSRTLENPSAVFNYVAYDIGEKLNKIKVSHNIKNSLIRNAVNYVLSNAGVPVGELASANQIVSRVFIDVSLYDLILTLYSLHAEKSKKKYFISCSKGKVNVIEKGTVVAGTIMQAGTNVITSRVKEDLDSLVNNVLIVDEKGVVITKIQDKESQSKHGLFQEVYQIQDDKDDYMVNASKMLSPFDTTINITGYGDIDCTTGRAIIVRDKEVGLQGVYYIESDKHTFENSKHIVDLTLKLENIMKISEAGETEEEFLEKLKNEENANKSRIEQLDEEGAFDDVKVNK